jgi:hypothetical protein
MSILAYFEKKKNYSESLTFFSTKKAIFARNGSK